MGDTIPYMTGELGVLQSQEIEHVMLIYHDKKVLQIERKDLEVTLKILQACSFNFRSIVQMGDNEDLYLLVSF